VRRVATTSVDHVSRRVDTRRRICTTWYVITDCSTEIDTPAGAMEARSLKAASEAAVHRGAPSA